jgi:hypothetical protein
LEKNSVVFSGMKMGLGEKVVILWETAKGEDT